MDDCDFAFSSSQNTLSRESIVLVACRIRSFRISHRHADAVIATATAMTQEMKSMNLVPILRLVLMDHPLPRIFNKLPIYPAYASFSIIEVRARDLSANLCRHALTPALSLYNFRGRWYNR
ncbi:MAG: hypothetical protein A4E60_02975 [Syntrophorhabdus sp. PtaB.Bin047]|nr:MAG: hypothetical protein A4E60_02975 [Syntrophorhabdus sp. PtaB.Bin047]